MKTGEKIRICRKEIGLSAEAVAAMLGVSPATIYRYENGDIEKIPVDMLAPLSKILKTTPSFLIGWENDAACAAASVSPSENHIQLAGRDGSYLERTLTDDQLKAILGIIALMPESDETRL